MPCRVPLRRTQSLRSGVSPLPLAITLLTVQRITVDIAREWLSVADICEYMGVSPFVVTKQLRSGSLPAVKFGREWRVARIDFEDWLNTQRTQPEGPQPD